VSSLLQDVRFGLRALRRSPLVSSLATLSLALAIGGNVTVFALVNALLFRPLPYPEAERIVILGEKEEGGVTTLTASPGNFLDWRERQRSFEDLGGFAPTTLSLGSGEHPEAVAAARVSPAVLVGLGAHPVSGRLFRPGEAIPGADRVVLLSHDFRARRFAPDRDPVGETLALNGVPHEIVGTLPVQFEFFQPGVQLWAPLAFDRESAPRAERSVTVVGRLRPGVTMAQARDDMARVAGELRREHPEANRGWVVELLNLRDEIPDSRGRTSFALLQGAVFFVLLIACANVANLLLARGQERRRELALRSILGAGPGRVVRQLLTESLVLASLGGALGLALAWVGVRALAATFAAALPRFWTPVLDTRVTLFALGLSLLAGLIFGLAPALGGLSRDLASVVREGGRGTVGSSRRRMTRFLVVAEIALSLVLLAGSGILLRSFLDLRHADPGFEPGGLVTVPVQAPPGSEGEALRALEEALLERARAVPGVRAATLATALPQNVFNPAGTYTIDAAPPAPGEAHPRGVWAAVDPGYLEAIGIPLLQGRFFERGDGPGAEPVVVVNRALAERHWPGGDPLGRRLTFRDRSRRVVGVVGDTRQSLIRTGSGSEPALYLALAQQPEPSGLFLLLRSAVDVAGLAPELRRELQAQDPRLTLGTIQTLDQFIDQFFVGVNVFGTVLTSFGLLALLLAAIGTYGVLAYGVSQRSREIGVRLAIGARRGQVVGMITRQGLVLGLLGLALGAPGVVLISRVVRSVLIHASEAGAGMVAGAAGVLMLATLAASLVPALRAASLDPSEVLRGD
jgi:predicted permease